MLRNVKDLRGFAIRAIDGPIGSVDDVYFDDEDWGVRYLVVETGTWLSGRKVLISPVGLGHAGWMARQLPVALTRAQVGRSPDIDTRKPVSRQHEAEYFKYYGYPYYWGGAGLWGMGAYPGSLNTEGRIEEEMKARQTLATQPPEDCHLRSSNAVIGHHIAATDGGIGHVEDLLVDDDTWAIRYWLSGTGNWWNGHRVLIPPERIKGVSWSTAKVTVDMSRQAIKDAPPYDSAAQLEGQREQRTPGRHVNPEHSYSETRPRRPAGPRQQPAPGAGRRRQL